VSIREVRGRKATMTEEKELPYKCPWCLSGTRVKDVYHKTPFMMVRYRVCTNPECGRQCTTKEILDLSNPLFAPCKVNRCKVPLKKFREVHNFRLFVKIVRTILMTAIR